MDIRKRRGKHALGRSPHRADGTVFPGGRRRVTRRRRFGSGGDQLASMLKKQPDVASFCQHVQFGTAFASGVRYLQSMLKPPNDTRYLAVIRRLCESAEKEHIETAHLIERLVAEPRYVASAVATPSSKPRPRRTRRPR